MSTVTFSPAMKQQALPLRSAWHDSTAWPAARVKRVAMRAIQIAAVCLLLASIPDDSGPIRHQAPSASPVPGITLSSNSLVRMLNAADR